jgi:transcriptional regulator with XRE-family HTH domain
MARASSEGSPRFADLLNHLFATRLSPRCKPYTLKEVSEGTGGYFSVAYLSLLRRGGIERPSLERMRRLADFFDVESSYFVGVERPEDRAAALEMDESLRHAFTDPQLRAFAMRVNDYSLEERSLVLAMLDQVHRLVESRRASLERSRTGDTPDDEEPLDQE